MTTDMNGTIMLETTNMNAFTLEVILAIESGGPRFQITPYTGNVYGFNSGEIGAGTGGYTTSGYISVPSGSAGETTRLTLGNMTWELSDV